MAQRPHAPEEPLVEEARPGGDWPPRARPLFWAFQALALVLVAGLLGLLVWRVLNSGHGPTLVREIKQGKKPHAPAFSLPVLWDRAETWPRPLRKALDDGRISPAELRGSPVVINFWASWCGPCKDEAPRLAGSSRAHAGKVVFLGIDVQDFKSDARRFLDRFDTPYVSVRDGGGSTYAGYGLTGVPETYWLDARGRIVGHYPGEISRDLLEQGIQLAEARG
jgi:cytochrome c biogenesis protein CcmG, thiol:disulfide interchange protein DsbE